MEFKEIFKKSFTIVNKAIPFILFYYLLTLFMATARNYRLPIIVSLLSAGLGFLIFCGILGTISKIIEGGDISFKSFVESIKFFFFRYLGATLILAILGLLYFIPYFIFFVDAAKDNMSNIEFLKTMPGLLTNNLFILLFGILTIYVFPFVFVKGKGADAIFGGISYLFKNFKNSSALIIMGIVKVAVLTVISGFALKYPIGSLQYISLISVNSFILIYIEFAIFAGACHILNKDFQPEPHLGDMSGGLRKR